jgi:hypothetical protein
LWVNKICTTTDMLQSMDHCMRFIETDVAKSRLTFGPLTATFFQKINRMKYHVDCFCFLLLFLNKFFVLFWTMFLWLEFVDYFYLLFVILWQKMGCIFILVVNILSQNGQMRSLIVFYYWLYSCDKKVFRSISKLQVFLQCPITSYIEFLLFKVSRQPADATSRVSLFFKVSAHPADTTSREELFHACVRTVGLPVLTRFIESYFSD